MTRSMTGFASHAGQGCGFSWSWDLRAANGRGLDVRLRVPDWIDGLEQATRALVQKSAHRGNLSLTLRLTREAGSWFSIDEAALAAAVALVRRVEDEAAGGDLALSPVRATDLLQMRGVLAGDGGTEQTAALRDHLLEDLPPLLEEFDAARRREGAVLADLLEGHLAEVGALLHEARMGAARRLEAMPDRLAAALDRIGATADLDETRLMQEIALLATRADVTEEIDRLDAHVAAARDLLAGAGPKGRKLDFLVQEFNREANTICSKSQSVELTRTGVAMKTVIDQMREQVQNVE